ncbi:MAG: SH3 domain-containing protein [Anaerolineaceae bacterium]|nr:SH3 domain-containing protein [Chloroflexota bacterium]MCY4008370.1 SH3 domain-containing protein [Anaerolineaceae bacterium]
MLRSIFNLSISFLCFISLYPVQTLLSQVSTATPAPAILATATPIPSITPVFASPSPSSTPFSGIALEALERANVRSAPDVDSEILGEIVRGERYPVIGRFFRWIQFEFRLGPGWVFEELVIIHGDSAQLPEINLIATPEEVDFALTATLAILTQTPGGLQTATSQAQLIDAPNIAAQDRENLSDPSRLPTFTYPPQFVQGEATRQPSLEATPTPLRDATSLPSELPPILPIALLGGLGILGLLISLIRK